MPVVLRSAVGGYSRRRLLRTLASVLRRLDVGDFELSLSIVGARAMRSANRRFFRRDAPTDVIAISQVEGGRMPMPEKLLGDVIVSIDAARTQAAAAGHSLETELSILAVHGILHTLGMDDRTPAERGAMMTKTLRLLRPR